MRTPLTRSIPFWILLVASVGLAVAGAILISQHLGTMTKTLGDGSATGLEVYGGQSWIVVGAALLGAGLLGVLLTLALAAATSLVPRRVDSPLPQGDGVVAEEDVQAAPQAADALPPAEPVDEAPGATGPVSGR